MRVHPYAAWSVIAVFLMVGVASLLHLTTGLASVWSYLVAANLITLLLYRVDKWVAPHGWAPRIPNTVLVLLAAVGGAFGALLGVAAGHKTSSRYRWLRRLIWSFAGLQLIVLVYLLILHTAW